MAAGVIDDGAGPQAESIGYRINGLSLGHLFARSHLHAQVELSTADI
jgi:hypothetical protein